MESVDRFNLAALALICLKNETKAGAERDAPGENRRIESLTSWLSHRFIP